MPFFTTTTKNKQTTPTPTTSDTTTPTATMVTNKHLDTTDELKDVREFEHGRQKAKKTARTQVWHEARRIKAGEVWTLSPPYHRKRVGSKGTFASVHPDWAVDRWTAQDADDEWIREFVEEERNAHGSPVVRSEGGRLEVDLTNLMKPAKTRKGNRGTFQRSRVRSWKRVLIHRVAAGDFEVLPSVVRQVVALDDRLDGELEADEPWEHLSADGEDEKVFSYAEVAALP